jgi:hypothetical protein
LFTLILYVKEKEDVIMRTQITFYAFILLLFVVSNVSAATVIIIDGNFDDWKDVPVLIKDPDDIAEDNGDIKEIQAYSTTDTFYAMLTVYGTAAPKDNQRYYYHILIDADNNIKTGYDNSIYEGNPTGVKNPIGADFYAQIGRRSGVDDGIEVYFLTANTADVVAKDFEWAAGGDSIEMAIPFEMFTPLQNIGDIFKVKQTIMIAAFQEGDANDWEVDWTESAEHIVGVPAAVKPVGKLPVTWATIKGL